MGSGPLVLSLTKGIEPVTGRRMTEVLREVLTDHEPNAIGVLSGPNLAHEVMAGHPSATCVAFPDVTHAESVQQLLMSDRLRVYTSPDVIGCEIGGAVKNVIAIAAGVADGLGYGMNTKAALITRGLAELSRLGVAAGGQALTFLGLAGNGDLIATCSSPQSRNHRVGQQLAAGRSVGDIVADSSAVAEGVETAPAVVELSRRLGVDMPICETVDAMLAGQLAPADALLTLMRREPKGELDGLPTITTVISAAGSPDEPACCGSRPMATQRASSVSSAGAWTTATGQVEWYTHCWLTDPTSRRRSPPRPRDPTTRRSASRAASSSVRAGAPLAGTSSMSTPASPAPAVISSSSDLLDVSTIPVSGGIGAPSGGISGARS